MRAAAISVWLLAAAGCAGGQVAADAGDADATPTPGADAGVQSERSCETAFTYVTAPGSVGTVEIAGGWNWDERAGLIDPEGDGVYEARLPIAPGVWPYKLIVDGNWILDPAQPYRAYDGGLENSAVIVSDCHDPLLELEAFAATPDGAATATLRVRRGFGGPSLAPGEITATRRFEFADTQATVALDGELAVVSLSGLPAGKHTLTITAQDSAGRAAQPLVLPFWIEAKPFDWRGPLYMIMLDRFRNGDPSNDPGVTPGATASADFLGGDIRGITDAIEDGTLEELGITTIWVSPWVRNVGGFEIDAGHAVTGYHGYWPTRAREIDPRFGSEADLEAMVTAAHRRGIRVLMDYVINHVHEDHEYMTSNPSWFRTGCECGGPGCDWTEHRLDCSFHSYMPDVDWQQPEAGWAFVEDALWWLQRYDLDGLRVDAVKHVEDLAIFNLSAAIHDRLERAGTEYFLLGETAMGWNGDDLNANLSEYGTISRYIGEYALTGQFDFVLYHGVSYRVWAREERGLLHADYWTKASQEQYPASAIMTPFIGSHDSSRFVSLADTGGGAGQAGNKWPEQGLPGQPGSDLPYQRAALGYVWVLSLPGAPLLYYGDEYGEYGGADPDNRHMWRGPGARSAREQALHVVISRMGRARRDHVALRQGGYRTLLAEEGFLAFARETQAEFAVVVINKSGAPATRTIEIPGGAGGGVSAVVNVLAAPGSGSIAVSGGQATVTVPAMGAMVLVAAGP